MKHLLRLTGGEKATGSEPGAMTTKTPARQRVVQGAFFGCGRGRFVDALLMRLLWGGYSTGSVGY